MLGASATVAYGLATGFDRTASKARTPDIVATFQPERRDAVARFVSSLANVRAASYRLQVGHVYLSSADRFASDTTLIGLQPGGPLGYALVSGRDLRSRGEAVVEQGLARSWHLRLGSPLDLGGAEVRVVGVAVAPDNVAYPLARQPRVWVGYREATGITGASPGTV